jgi:hypothetical protein
MLEKIIDDVEFEATGDVSLQFLVDERWGLRLFRDLL